MLDGAMPSNLVQGLSSQEKLQNVSAIELNGILNSGFRSAEYEVTR